MTPSSILLGLQMHVPMLFASGAQAVGIAFATPRGTTKTDLGTCREALHHEPACPHHCATSPPSHFATARRRHFATRPLRRCAIPRRAPSSKEGCLHSPGHHVAAAQNGIFRPPSQYGTAYASTRAVTTLVCAAYWRAAAVTGLWPKVEPFG